MADIHHVFPIDAPPADVFAAIATPEGISAWWSRETDGTPELGNVYDLDFGAGYEWKAEVTRCVPGAEFELTLTEGMHDWLDTRVSFDLKPKDGGTTVAFVHAGWSDASEHFRISAFCWAMYLRLMKKYVEEGAIVPYGERLDA